MSRCTGWPKLCNKRGFHSVGIRLNGDEVTAQFCGACYRRWVVEFGNGYPPHSSADEAQASTSTDAPSPSKVGGEE